MANPVPTPRTGVRLEKLDDDVMLMDDSRQAIIYLNPTAALVWQLCDGIRNLEELVTILTECFPEAGSEIEHDVHRICERFATQGVVDLL